MTNDDNIRFDLYEDGNMVATSITEPPIILKFKKQEDEG